MSAPREMFELQLGHLCNDRCVFCISGRLTARREAPLLGEEMLAARMRSARAAGHRAITFLGGEPTIQPVFLSLVRLAVELGFNPIVVFTNGGKAGRTNLVERVLATGGRFEWRFSFQGATREAHDATTRRRGSFRQLLTAVERVAARGQRITVNTCVVAQNYASLDAFPALLAPYDVAQLHLDMIHPEDTGNLSLEELRPMMVAYRDVAPVVQRMVAGFTPGFDVNVGNLPPCIAPDLWPFIHHGGRPTETAQAHDFGLPVLQPSRDKYAHKERLKVKIDGCRSCVFDATCSGLFPEYASLFGTGELAPVAAPAGLSHEVARALARTQRTSARLEAHAGSVEIASEGTRLVIGGREVSGAHARYDRGSLRVVEVGPDPAHALAWARALERGLVAEGWRIVHPVGEDAVGALAPRLTEALRRFRRAAPFGALSWTDVSVRDEGRRVLLGLSIGAERVEAWVDDAGSGYRVGEGREPHGQALTQGLRKLFAALRAPSAS